MVWEHPVSLLSVYAGFYLVIVFLSLSIACGLYYLAELCEEYVITAKRIIGHTIKAELLLHLVLLWDRLPLLCLGTGLAAHASYLCLLKPFPYVQLGSTAGITSVALWLASTGLWIRHFMGTYYTMEYIAAFLLLTTWLVPFAFFLGMSGDNAVLPGAGGYPYSVASSGSSGSLLQRTPSGRPAAAAPSGRKRRGLMLRIFDTLRRKRDAVLPELAKQLPDASHLLKEKI
ncbi:Transmembrane adaptor Erv26 [Micractinium conductrix]|uniref:Transmembrane adaptor Erv26 n=1 Tax=Micractinium conductrix TaxID=554055 RepID=A0A2P6VC05_9CHLO|nr:Transmembrane adaptor Erv26 [Micractinium conductrix]|eukprot:PSC71623.1 Transmembrane adaptor Erv26 [Micractinium conductrix]